MAMKASPPAISRKAPSVGVKFPVIAPVINTLPSGSRVAVPMLGAAPLPIVVPGTPMVLSDKRAPSALNRRNSKYVGDDREGPDRSIALPAESTWIAAGRSSLSRTCDEPGSTNAEYDRAD